MGLGEGHRADDAAGGLLRTFGIGRCQVGKAGGVLVDAQEQLPGQALVLEPQQAVHHPIELGFAFEEAGLRLGAEMALAMAQQAQGPQDLGFEGLGAEQLIQPVALQGLLAGDLAFLGVGLEGALGVLVAKGFRVPIDQLTDQLLA